LDRLTQDYFLFVFVAVVGVLQVVAAYNKGLSWAFFRSSILGYLFGAAAIVAAFWWFFSSGNRNTPGLNGLQQLAAFSGAAFLAYLTSAIMASKVRLLWRWMEMSAAKGHSSRQGRASKSFGLDSRGK